jgi:hypothetical protein
MRGCVRASERFRRLPIAAAALLALAAAACSPNVLSVVDPKDPLLDGLVGWWRFEEGPGATVVHDASGNGNDATIMDLDTGNPLTWPPGHAGASLETAGAGYALVPLSASIGSIVNGITISAWVYYEGGISVDFGTAISRAIGTSLNQHYHLSIYKDDSPVLFLTTVQDQGVAMTRVSQAITVPRFAWTQLAGTYDGATVRLYFNGQSVNSPGWTGPLATDTTPVILGGNQNGDMGVTERFPGRIDEIMLYKRALSPAEVLRLYNGALLSSSAAGP